MKTRLFAAAVWMLVAVACTSASAQNLLKNPGFEDPAGWSTDWTIRDANGGNLTYHYHLTEQGGGHGDARPRTGKNAVEIYSTDLVTYLVQKVRLEPGTYRLSAWVRSNAMPGSAPLEIRLGDKKVLVPIISQKYRLMWADFKIETDGEYEASLFSTSYGVAVDDLSLEKVTESSPKPPAVYVELQPSSKDKAAGIQHCLKGSLQLVDFVTTCVDQSSLKRPVMRILASEPVKLSGLNEGLIHHYRMRDEDQVKLQPESAVRDGKKYRGFSFLLPRFAFGLTTPMTFGGFWVSDVPAKGGKVIMEILDGENLVTSEEVKLVVVDPPKVSRTPKKYYTFAYAVQNWMLNLEERKQAIPAQFKMIGFNVWSDGPPPEKASSSPTDDEMVLKEAYDKYGIRQFWPNFCCILDTSAGGCYSDKSGTCGDKDMYVVNRDGSVNRNLYNGNYAANRGRAWMESSIAAWTHTLLRPAEANLPFKYSGLVNDGLEGMHASYDPSSLAAFAAFKGVDPGQVTVDKLSGEWNKDWQLFNMDLYTRVVDIWTEQARRVDPEVNMVNTASTYGPGGYETLTPVEHMKWARSIGYSMPQWYASNYYGTIYADFLKEGEAAGVFGKTNGGADLLPLLNLSMGAELVDTEGLRFTALDYFSSSKSVKGVGYYIASNAFTDAKYMVELSGVHTLIADIEDFYADGVRDDSLVKATQLPADGRSIVGMDLEGQQIAVTPKSFSSVRVHVLNRGGRVALITVISYNDQGRPGIGDRISLSIDKNMLPKPSENLVLIDRLTGRRQPLSGKILVDTRKTGNVAVFEIAAGER